MSAEKINLPNGLECYVLSREETNYIFSEIFTEQQYIQHGIVVKEGDCIVDVGANIGLFTLFINRLQKHLTVYAFEPIPEIFAVLQENVSLHSLFTTQVFNYGLGSENNSEKLFTFYPNMAGNSTTRPEEKALQQEVMSKVMDDAKLAYFFQSYTVKGRLRTLSSVMDELGIEAIDLLKIDVEGEEYEVLAGIEQKDWGKIKQVVAEVQNCSERLQQVNQLLAQHGFNVSIEHNPLVPSELNNFNVYAIR